MIDTDKVRLMTRIAAYEDGPGKKDIRMNRCKRSTYVAIKVTESLLFMTIAYAGIASLYSMRYISAILKDGVLTMKTPLIHMGIIYVVLLIAGWFLTARYYNRSYREAHKRIIHYDKDLKKLEHYLNKVQKEPSIHNAGDINQ